MLYWLRTSSTETLILIIIIIIKTKTSGRHESKNYRKQQYWALDSTVESATVTVHNINPSNSELNASSKSQITELFCGAFIFCA
jgi:hypothetical protein